MRTAYFSKVAQGGLAVSASFLMLTAFTAPLEAGEKRGRSDTQAVSAASAAPQTSRSASSSRSSTRAGVTRSQGRSSGGTATRNPQSRPPRSHRSAGRYYHRNYWSLGWGLGYHPWGYYGRYYPYYPIFPTLYYGPYPGEYRDYRLGALDLNVKPKKTQVWVDGQLIGPSGKFDGFPGYLWLERGRHQLVFHHPGFETEVREVRALQGAVVRLHLRLNEGESVPPEDLIATRPERRRPARRPRPVESPGAMVDDPAEARSEPGRLRLSIEPGDASVYLDGRFLGTARELRGLHAGLLVDEGAHSLEVVRPGYRSESLDLMVVPEDEMEIDLELEPE